MFVVTRLYLRLVIRTTRIKLSRNDNLNQKKVLFYVCSNPLILTTCHQDNENQTKSQRQLKSKKDVILCL